MPDAPFDGSAIAFETPSDRAGLEVVDRIERRRYRLETSGPVAPDPVDVDAFRFPVERAVAIETDALRLPTVALTCVRDTDGAMLAEAEHHADEQFPEATYSIELCVPVKLYVRVTGAVSVQSGVERMVIEFDEPRRVLIGARSSHERPAATVTTTEEPADVLAAISTFGSGLKTTSPERSFPTLRGHPPSVEVGDELSIPEGLEPPVDDVHVEVPPEYGYAYPVAPLSYYLGTAVEPGPEPRIVGDGIDYPLGASGSFQTDVERTLKRTFFLDCVTRTEGLYRVDLHERGAIEDELDLDFAALYDAPFADRLAAYLDVPFEAVEPHLPEWKLASHVTEDPTSIETLPFLVDDLAIVRVGNPTEIEPSALETGAIHGMVRGEGATEEPYVRPGEAIDSLEEAWVGEGMPLEASKALPEAYRNRIGREPAEDSIDIAVVCNDPEMDEERDVVDEVYGSRSDLAFDVTVRRDLTTGELEALLDDRFDLLHYVGHIDDGGFRCSDGLFDVGGLDEVGIDAFVLNACRSYRQGMDLIAAGAIGGIVTLSDVVNTGAIRIGADVARLLNSGFPLGPALDVASDQSVIGVEYSVIGDGSLTIVQPESDTAQLYEVERAADGFNVAINCFSTKGMGELFFTFIESNDEYYLNSGRVREFELEESELQRFLSLENVPVLVNGELRWSSSITPADI